MQSNPVFRKVALDRLSSPEQLDQLMYVTNPKSWLALIALLALLITAVTWSIIGSIPVEVSGQAILLNSGGIKNIVAVAPGQVTTLHIAAGTVVAEGELIAEVTPLGETEAMPVYSPYNGRILELKTDTGSLIGAGASVASLEFVGDGVEQEVVMYVDAAEGKRIQAGMPVQITPITAQAEEHGFLLGEVKSVSDFPATNAGILRLLGSEELMAALGIANAPIELRIALIPDSQTASGYRWSSSQGPDFTIDNGTLASAKITVDSQRPINLILPLQ